ncbi:unnamed protein product, partial [Prunus brigantina]
FPTFFFIFVLRNRHYSEKEDFCSLFVLVKLKAMDRGKTKQSSKICHPYSSAH